MSNSGKRQPGHRDHAACGRLCRGDQGDEEHLVLVLAPSDCYSYQGLGRLVRLCRGGDRFELRHHLPDGRRATGRFLCREEYDRQPDGYDVRRCEAELFVKLMTEFDGCAFGDAGYGEPFGFVGRGLSTTMSISRSAT